VDPSWLFPLLAIGFGVAGLAHRLRAGRIEGAGRTWWLLALIFGAVALWLHWHR
jgi:hypothetical protein